MTVPEPPRQRQNFLGGFKLTLEHLGRLPVTRQYPEEKRPKQPRQHGRHVLNRYEDGMEKCIGRLHLRARPRQSPRPPGVAR
jgi:formate hydrogenlyase subunit 6/NADH:ubiquinone oxidoreductase subunit I